MPKGTISLGTFPYLKTDPQSASETECFIKRLCSGHGPKKDYYVSEVYTIVRVLYGSCGTWCHTEGETQTEREKTLLRRIFGQMREQVT